MLNRFRALISSPQQKELLQNPMKEFIEGKTAQWVNVITGNSLLLQEKTGDAKGE